MSVLFITVHPALHGGEVHMYQGLTKRFSAEGKRRGDDLFGFSPASSLP